MRRSNRSSKGNAKAAVSVIVALIIIIAAYFGLVKAPIDPAGADISPTLQLKTPEITHNITPQTSPGITSDGTLDVYFFDVGQGDCIFMRTESGKTMLIDCGEYSEYDTVDAFLQEQNVSSIDVVIATHPHSDHIGCMRLIIENYEIGAFYMPDKEHTSNAYAKMVERLIEYDVTTIIAEAGDKIELDSNVEINVLSPVANASYSELNNYSIAIHVTYGDMSLLLAGDAEAEVEQLMVETFAEELKSTVFKASHHGSSTSNTRAFLEAIDPECVIIQLAADNSYGHPHSETMELLSDLGVNVYRNDLNGTIHIEFTHSSYTVICEKTA